MRILFVGDVVSGKSILEVATQVGDLVAIGALSEAKLELKTRSNVFVFDHGELNKTRIISYLKKLKIDLIVNFNSTKIFSKELLSCPRLGAINFHPGLLPEYAGLNVHQWAMLNGEPQAGVSIHVITSQIDAGPILARSTIDISHSDTGLTLYMKLLKSGSGLMKQVLRQVAVHGFDGALPQDLSKRRLYKLGQTISGRVDFGCPAEKVAKFIRALSYRPMRSPLGVPYIQAAAGCIEIGFPTILAIKPRANVQPGTLVDFEADFLTISCSDNFVQINAAWLDNKRIGLNEVASRLELAVGDVF